MTPTRATCHVCDTPDGDHLDWCTPQAREQRPSKDLVSRLREQSTYLFPKVADTLMEEAAAEVERLREDCRRWENARNVWMAEEKRLKALVARLKQYISVTALAGYRCAACAERLTAQPKPAHEREMPHCSTCSCPPYPKALDDETLLAIAQQWDQGPGSTFEFDAPTLLRFMRNFAATVEGMVRDGAAPEPEPTHFAFLIKRPRDKEAWPTIFASREGAEGYEHRASPVVPVCLTQPPRDGQ